MKPNYNFITSFAMRCDEEQFESVKNELEEMGYNDYGYEGLKNYSYIHFWGRGYSDGIRPNINDFELVFEPFNRDLCLALAAMTDKADGIKGEWWKCVRGDGAYFKTNNIYEQVGIIEEMPTILSEKQTPITCICCDYFIKATATELIEHFTAKVDSIEPKTKLIDGEVARLTKRIDDLEYNVRLLTANMDKLIQQPQPEPTKLADKQEVWAWDDDDIAMRYLGFYDAINDRLFDYNGGRDELSEFDNYEPIPADQIPQWMKDAKPKLQD